MEQSVFGTNWGELYYPVANGRLGLNIIKTGEFNDYFLEYFHYLNSRDRGLIIRTDPVMESLELGYLGHYGKLMLPFSRHTTGELPG